MLVSTPLILREALEPAADPTPDPAAVAADPAPDPAPEPEPSWAGPTQEEWQQTQQYLQSVGEALPTIYQQLQGMAPQPVAPAEPELTYDPFDQNSVQSYIETKVGNLVQGVLTEKLGPLEGLLGMVAQEKGEALAKQELDRLGTEIGTFDSDTAYAIAAGMIDRGADPSQALQTGARHAFELEQRIRNDERERYKAELAQLGQAPPEIQGGQSPAEVETVPTGPDRYKIAIDRALARRRPVMPTG